jgi:hypothetical protein
MYLIEKQLLGPIFFQILYVFEKVTKMKGHSFFNCYFRQLKNYHHEKSNN